MLPISRRPFGLVVIVLLLVLAGLASLVESAQLIVMAAGGWPDAIPAALIGLLLLYRAYGLWRFRHGAWLVTALLLVLKAAAAAVEIVRGQAVSGGWVALGLATIALLYLLDPTVRSLFSADRDGR